MKEMYVSLYVTCLLPTADCTQLCDFHKSDDFNETIHAAIVLVVCESGSGRFIRCEVSDIIREHLQTVFNKPFARCQENMKAEGARFPNLQ